MSVNVGGQAISLKFMAPGNSEEINRRFLNTHPVGIYSGGILTISDGAHAIISSLVCEVGDGTYQVRVQTTLSVTLAVTLSTPYVVLRWAYTGTTADYMELLAVASGSVLSTDLTVGKCVFTAGSLSGFDYGDATHSRTVPSVHDLCLKVVPTVGSTLKTLVMPGWVHGQQQSFFVPMQETSALVPPVTYPKIYLVTLSDAGVISIDSTGVEAVVPVEPNHDGRLVLAQIKLSPGDAVITADKITDVRPFLTPYPSDPDEVTITKDSSGLLKVVDPVYLVAQTVGAQLSNKSAWTLCSTGMLVVKQSGIAIPSGVITLPAGKLYKISYSIVFQGQVGTPMFESRLHVMSGDVSWEFKDDANNVSWQKSEAADSPSYTTLSGTYLILPASSTQVQLEVKTRDIGSQYGAVIAATISIWTT